MKNLKNLEKNTAKFIEHLNAQGGPPIYKLPISEARQVLESLQASPTEKLPVKTQDLLLSTGKAGKVSVRIVQPSNGTGALPAIIYFHGGGWILGSKNTHDRLVREIACGAQAAVVFVNFSPSPEAKYPKPLEEAYAALKYIADHGKELHLDPTRLAVAGDSVGGNMAIATTLLAKERGGPKIQYQVLFYPVTDANFNTPSYKEYADGPWLTKPAMDWFWNAYAPNLADRKKSTVCPLQASLEELKNLPPALIITDEHDVLRDEGEAFAHKLMQAGVEVTSIRYLGTIHDFAMLNALSHTPAARSALALANYKLHQALSQPAAAKQKRVA